MTGVAADAPPPPALLDRTHRVLLAALLVALMTSITAVGVVTGLLIVVMLLRAFDPALRERDRAPLVWPLLAFAVATVLSALYSDHAWVALVESKHLIGIAIFFAAVNGFRDGHDIRRALGWLLVVAMVVSLHAFAQVWACATPTPLPDWAAWALRLKLESCRASPLFRAKAFFSIYMTLGGSLVVVLALIVAALAHWAPKGRVLHAVAGVLTLAALGVTYVRSAWLGLGAAALVATATARRYAVLLILLAALALALAVPSPLQQRAWSILDPADPTASERLLFWDSGRRMVQDAPLLGLGPGGVKLAYPAYRHPGARRPGTGHLHNNLVQIAAERGLIGLGAWLVIWVAFFVQAGRVYARLPDSRLDDRALVAGSIAAVVGFHVAGLFEYTFGDSEVIGLVWVVMAFPYVLDPIDALAPDEA